MIGKINEIFSSIQGEGIFLGEKQIFVRLAGCNIRCCSYCDTEFESFQEYRPQELLSRLESFGRDFHSISLTGGEPLLQKDFLKEILPLLKQKRYQTYLETNGVLPGALAEVINNIDIVAMDIKLPSSSTNIAKSYWQEHGDFLKIAGKKDVFIKVVISSSTTEEDFVTMLALFSAIDYCGILVLQPNSFEVLDKLNEKLAVFKKLSAGYLIPTCIIPQMHKVMGIK